MDTIEVFYIVSHNWLSARSKFSVWHWMIDKLFMDCLETWGGSRMVISTWYNSNSCCWWEKPNWMRCLISGYFFLNQNEIGRTEVSSKKLVHCQVVYNKDSGTRCGCSVWFQLLLFYEKVDCIINTQEGAGNEHKDWKDGRTFKS
jgi:hypothetical protein